MTQENLASVPRDASHASLAPGVCLGCWLKKKNGQDFVKLGTLLNLLSVVYMLNLHKLVELHDSEGDICVTQ